MATRTSLQAHHSSSVTSMKQTLTPSSPPPPSNITLPDEFPAHLLLRICDTILQPLLAYNSPLKPHTKPWGRTMNKLTWPGSQKGPAVSNHPILKPVSSSSSKGVYVTGCKTDLLAWCLCNRRLWQICGERVYRHVKVNSLNIADILVSRRNHLRNTQVLEFYIHRDPEPSQAQTDLNLSRFFIQVGVIILWSPRLESLVIDIRSLPVDRYIWDSFLTRLRQRLFIAPGSDLLPSRSGGVSSDSHRRSLYDSIEIPPQPTSPDNNISGFGDEQPTMINSSARWGDSQGIINSPERVSVPHLAIGLGYNAAGELGAAEDGSATKEENGGFAKLMDQLLAFPVPNPVLPLGLVRALTPISGFGSLTCMDLLIPRPSWGHEEAEGYALGMILRRLSGLRRLRLHADGGGAAAGSSGHNDFGLMRKPPYGHIAADDSDSESSDIGELDMVVSEHGAVTYPSHGYGYPHVQNHVGTTHGRTSIASTSSPRSSGASTAGNILITGGAQEHRHRGYGAETWWAGVLCALSGSDEHSKSQDENDGGDEQGDEGLENDEKSPTESSCPPVPLIRELRISVSIPGHVQPQDFDAFYHLILPHLQAFEKLEILIFDMAFAVIPSEGTFAGPYTSVAGHPYNGVDARLGHAERYTGPGRFSSPGKYAAPSANDRFLWKEQENKANWLTDIASAGLGDLKRHLKRQKYYVEQLVDPITPVSEEPPAEAQRTTGHGHGHHSGQVNQASSGHIGSIPHRHGHGFRPGGKDNIEAPVLMKRHSEPEEAPTLQSLGIPSNKGIKTRTAPSLNHVYFGDYHGLPSLQPPDVEKTECSTTRVGRVESVFVDVADAASAVSSTAPAVSNTGAGKGVVTPGTPGSVMPNATAGATVAGSLGRGAGQRSASGKDVGGARGPGSSIQENERVVPGMWWTIRREGTPRNPRDKEGMEGAEFAGFGHGESLVVQGWEELEEDSVEVW